MGFLLADAERMTGDVAAARARLASLEAELPATPSPWALMSTKYAELGQFHDALRAANQLKTLAGGSRDGRALAAGALTALGRMDEAEAHYDGLIATGGVDTDAFYQRAVLRRARPGEAAIEQTRRRLADETDGSPASVPLHFAMAKMLEDIEEMDGAFDHLAAGARARRARLSYRVEDDEAAVEAIIATFNADWLSRVPKASPAHETVFVMGLPRSGTTLVERMLSSHSRVASLGEINDLAYAVMRAAGPAANKVALIGQAASADMARLGAHYQGAAHGYGVDAPVLIDKTPANFLYAGLIAAALPGARIIHLRRDPAASGYAMFKTLFRMGYPFSYDLEETARYIAAHRRLMEHWRGLMADQILEVDYEKLVDEPEPQVRRMLDHLGLDWEPGCLAFQDNPAPTATASAAQVRQPIHTGSRDQWRTLAHRLTSLTNTLESLGVTR
jgi:tetratricopeptide (TPR) repeat protein